MNTNENLELEQMRSQLNVLKGKLNEQIIVNDQLLRKAMQQKMSWISKYVFWQAIAVPFLVVFIFIELRYWVGTSWWLCSAWGLGLIGSATSDLLINRMKNIDWVNGNLADTAEQLLRMRQYRKRNEWIAIIILIPVLIWTAIEVLQSDALPYDLAIGLCISGAIGGLVGGIIGISIYRKMQHTNEDVINQIESLKAEA